MFRTCIEYMIFTRPQQELESIFKSFEVYIGIYVYTCICRYSWSLWVDSMMLNEAGSHLDRL